MTDTDTSYPPPDAWRGFQLGQRPCIGRELSYAELKPILALAACKSGIEPAWEDWELMALQQQGKKKKVKPHLMKDERLVRLHYRSATAHPKTMHLFIYELGHFLHQEELVCEN